jgi:tetratricopeptide (TPR) repeat protein
MALGQLDAAHQAYADSEILRRELIDQFGNSPERMRDLSVSLGRLGEIEMARGETASSIELFSRQIQTSNELIGKYGDTISSLEVLARACANLAQALETDGRAEEAKPWKRKAKQHYQRLQMASPENPSYANALAALSGSGPSPEPDTTPQ